MSLTNRSIAPAAVLMLVAGTLGLRATSSRNDFGNVYTSRTQARLAFAKLSADPRDTTLGTAEGNVYVLTANTVEFAWDAPDASRMDYWYQVATKPFPAGPPKRDVPSVVAGGLATPRGFTIKTWDFRRAEKPTSRTRRFYIRIVPVVNGVIVGPASNTVVIHSIFGNDPNAQYIVEYLWGDTVTAPPHPPRPSRAP